jgi:hypothetical protein
MNSGLVITPFLKLAGFDDFALAQAMLRQPIIASGRGQTGRLPEHRNRVGAGY